MTPSQPPTVATWLLTTLISGEKRESIIGDLIEQHGRGHSSGWYWRQTISAIVTTFSAEIWRHKLLAVSVAAVSTFLPDMYMYSKLWVLVHRLDRLWYPHLINSRWSWIVVNPWAYRLEPYLWTSHIAWCAILAALSWIISHSRPRQRGLAITVFLLPQVCLRVPYVWTTLSDGWRASGDPIWFYGLFWYSIFTFVAVPFSIILAAHAGSRRDSPRSLGR